MKGVVFFEVPEEQVMDELLHLLRSFGVENDGAEFTMFIDKYSSPVVSEAFAVMDRFAAERFKKS